MKKTQEHDNEILKKLMDHPVFLGHNATGKIIKTQLFFIAASTILLIGSGVKIGHNSSILGIRLDGLTKEHVLTVAFLLLVYQTIHFCWVSWEALCEWRVRQTALETASWGGRGLNITSIDSSDKARQTTLYAYLIDILEFDIKKFRPSSDDKELVKKTQELEKSTQKIKETIESERIGISLWRFDNWFKMFCKAQNYRWVIFELFLPLLIGIIAIFLSIQELFFTSLPA